MKKVLLFEPWHLGDVAVALSVTKQFLNPYTEFALVCNKKWKEWALGTCIVKDVIEFSPPWTFREKKDKYNPLNYKIRDIVRFKNEVLHYNPDVIIDIRGDVRANIFLSILFANRVQIKSSKLSIHENVYNRGEIIQSILNYPLQVDYKETNGHFSEKVITLFFGAADYNRSLPMKHAAALLVKLSEANFKLNLILQPTDNLTEFQDIKQRHSLNHLNLLQGSIQQMAEAISKSSIVISTDSGWLHIAYLYNKPTIGLFGFDTIQTWLPPGSSVVTPEFIYPAKYRYKKRYKYIQPLSNINTNEVTELVQQLYRTECKEHFIITD